MLAYIIPKSEAYKYHQIKFDWWWGVDATEKDDGNYFISKEMYDLIPIVSLKNVLQDHPLLELSESDFKITEEVIKVKSK